MSPPRLRKLPPIPQAPPKKPAPATTAPDLWEVVVDGEGFRVRWSPTARVYNAQLDSFSDREDGIWEFTDKNRQPVVDWLTARGFRWEPKGAR